MADEAGSNWAAIRAVFNGGPDNVMVDRERSCLFHWEQSLQKHTKKHIGKDKVQTHLNLCEAWRNLQTVDSAKDQATVIRRWWRENVLQDNIISLERWFKWWEMRIDHWGNISNQVY